MNARHWTRAEVLRQPLFWALIPGMAGFSALGTAFWFHQVHYATVKDWDHLALVALFPLGTAVFMASTAVYGWAIDRFGSARLLPIYLLPLALGFATLAYAPSLPFAALGVMLMGLAGGGQATLPAAAWAEIYGTRHLGAIKALVTALLVAGSAIGPGISGWLIDMGIDLTQQLWGFAAYFIAAAALMVVPLARARSQTIASAVPPQIDV